MPAVRTAGGHFRVAPESLADFVRGQEEDTRQAAGIQTKLPLRCWEHLSDHGHLRDNCARCIVYTAHASWCFGLARLPEDIGHARLFCGQSCDECSYYRRVMGMPARVLVVSADTVLRETLSAQARQDVAFNFAETGYAASAAMSSFHPDFVVLDHGTLGTEALRLLDCIKSDPRGSNLKVILATRSLPARGVGQRAGNWVIRIRLPITASQLVSAIERFPVELYVPQLKPAPVSIDDGD